MTGVELDQFFETTVIPRRCPSSRGLQPRWTQFIVLTGTAKAEHGLYFSQQEQARVNMLLSRKLVTACVRHRGSWTVQRTTNGSEAGATVEEGQQNHEVDALLPFLIHMDTLMALNAREPDPLGTIWATRFGEMHMRRRLLETARAQGKLLLIVEGVRSCARPCQRALGRLVHSFSQTGSPRATVLTVADRPDPTTADENAG